MKGAFPKSRNLACGSKQLRGMFGVGVGAMVACVGYNVLAERLVAAADRAAPRDPATGILLGAEPRDLGPADSPSAALLVHGFVGAGNNFGVLPERLAEQGWRIRVMLLPGHGTSPRDVEHVTVDELLQAVLDEYRALRAKHERVVLIGHSMGGALCTLVAAQQQVDALVLAAPYFGVTHRWYYFLRPETWNTLASPAVRWLCKGKYFMRVKRKEAKDQIVSYRWIPSRSVETLAELGRRAGSPATLERVSCRILWVHGRRDGAASPEAAGQAVQAMASSEKRSLQLDSSDHIIFWDFDRKQVIEEITRFLGPPKVAADVDKKEESLC